MDGGESNMMGVFDATDPEGRVQAQKDIEDRYEAHGALADIQIGPAPDLIGIDEQIYRRIEALLRTKRHLMFYGPPGTGKTTLAEHVAQEISPGAVDPKVITASSDWSSQDVIGGYQPIGEGEVAFRPGVLLENFDRPVAIDEFNRADIDKAFGPLFTVLSGHAVTLPYSANLAAEDRERIQILSSPTAGLEEYQYAPEAGWRLLATINTADKASLYQMSYALSRRFGWVRIGVPSDLRGFCEEYLQDEHDIDGGGADDPCPIADIWEAVNEVRKLGPAPFIDTIDYCLAQDDGFDFFAIPTDDNRDFLVDGINAFVVPLLDGVIEDELRDLAKVVSESLMGEENSEALRKVEEVLLEMAV
jgi:DNA polymerase III delta prime subunit